MPEVSALEPVVIAVPPPLDTPATAAKRNRRIGEGIAMLVAGIVIMTVALVVIGRTTGMVKVPVFLVSLIVLFAGLDRIGKAIWGAWFDTGFWLSFVWLIGLAFVAIVADLLPLSEYQDPSKTMSVPGNAAPDLFSRHPLGTNNFSLDLLARSIYGARVSLLTVTAAVAISMVIGGTIGMLAGYFRGWVDHGVGVLTDAILSFPALILLVALAAVLGEPQSVTQAVLKNSTALAVVGVPTMVRLARANTMVFAQREFVLASKAMGAKSSRIIFKEILPNVILPVVSYAFIIIAVLIVAEGSLAYLGLGLQQPKPTWGNMIAEGGLDVLRDHPHIALVPGIFMFLTVFSFNRVGERARSLWDPRDTKL